MKFATQISPLLNCNFDLKLFLKNIAKFQEELEKEKKCFKISLPVKIFAQFYLLRSSIKAIWQTRQHLAILLKFPVSGQSFHQHPALPDCLFPLVS